MVVNLIFYVKSVRIYNIYVMRVICDIFNFFISRKVEYDMIFIFKYLHATHRYIKNSLT